MKNLITRARLLMLATVVVLVSIWGFHEISHFWRIGGDRRVVAQKFEAIRGDWRDFSKAPEYCVIFVQPSHSHPGQLEIIGVVATQEDIDKAVSFLATKMGGVPIKTSRVVIDKSKFEDLKKRLDSSGGMRQ